MSAFAVWEAGVVLASGFVLVQGRGAVLMTFTSGAGLSLPVLVIAIPLAFVATAVVSLRALPLGLCALTALTAAMFVDVLASAPAEVTVPTREPRFFCWPTGPV
jgi:hypothetical protein